MSLAIKRSGDGVPAFRWTEGLMRKFAVALRSQMVLRAFDLGRGIDDQPHRGYSTTPLKLYRRSSTGRALSPKGGASFSWVRGPVKAGGGYDASRIGDEAGRFYEGGYAEYKLASRKGLTSSTGGAGVEVDLTLSGRLSRSIRVVSTTRTTATIAMTGDARSYGVYVDGARPFMGLSPEDIAEGQRILADLAESAMRSRK